MLSFLRDPSPEAAFKTLSNQFSGAQTYHTPKAIETVDGVCLSCFVILSSLSQACWGGGDSLFESSSFQDPTKLP